MATKKKKFKAKKGAPTPLYAYAAFIGDTLDGTIRPARLTAESTEAGQVVLDYEEIETRTA